MRYSSLNHAWTITDISISDCALLSKGGNLVDLPFCVKDGSLRLGKTIPQGLIKKNADVFVEIDGIIGSGEFYVNGCLAAHLSLSSQRINIKRLLREGRNTLGIVLCSNGAGAGVSGGVGLAVADSDVYIDCRSVFLNTVELSAKSASVDVFADIVKASSDKAVAAQLTVEIFNQKNRRVARKIRKLNIKADSTLSTNVRIANPFMWQPFDPYCYSVRVSLAVGERVVDEEHAVFGIRTFTLGDNEFLLNGEPFVVRGCAIESGFEILNGAFNPHLEARRLNALKDCGFNMVRVKGLPTKMFLEQCDKAGMLCMVDPIPKWQSAGVYFDLATHFERAIKLLRSHPSVAFYSLADCADETYGRADGVETAALLLLMLKQLDPSRLFTAVVTELAPTIAEIEKYADRAAIKRIEDSSDPISTARQIAREKDFFKQATAEFIELFDFICYDSLSHRYVTDKLYFPKRRILNIGATPKKGEANVLGDICTAGIDADSIRGGELDMTLERKPISFYNEIFAGARPKSFIATYEPECEDKTPENAVALWNYPRYLGKPITVDVFTSGDVVALYLNDKLVGRKLAGKMNKRTARFVTLYYPGQLTAVSYYKGVEHCRAELSSVNSPKAVRLELNQRWLNADEKEIAAVDIFVVDKENRRVPYASREISLSISPEAEIIASLNPHDGISADKFSVGVADGKAQVFIRALNEGKAVLTAESDGLRTDKARINIKSPINAAKEKKNKKQ